MKKKSRDRAIGVRLTALFIMGIAAVLYFMLEKRVPDQQPASDGAGAFNSTGVFLDFEIEDKADFYVTEKGSFFFCTKDGVEFYTASGEKKWVEVLNMINPVIYGEGDMLAVAEPKGRELYVYDTSGLRYSLQLEYPILRFSINRIGYTSVILQKDNEYEINVYGEKGGEFRWGWMAQDYNIFPVACAVSNDGAVVAFSLFDINDVHPVSNIVFAYISDSVDEGKYPDTIFSSKMRTNQLVGNLKFMSDGMVISVSDEEVVGMHIEETGKVTDKWTIAVHNKIDKISYNGDKGVALALGDGFLSKSPEPVGTVRYYDLKGQSTGEYLAGGKVAFLWAGTDAVVIGTTTGSCAVDVKGKKLWDHKAGTQIKQMALLGNANNILTVTNTKAELLKRAKG